MNNDQIKILAIETSCDETSAAVIFAGGKNTGEQKNRKIEEQIPVIMSNIVSSQIDLHAKTGGVVPEVASRAHMEAMIPVIEEALLQVNHKIQETRNDKNDAKQETQWLGDGNSIARQSSKECHSERSRPACRQARESQHRVSGSKYNSEDSSCLLLESELPRSRRPAGTAVPQNDNYLNSNRNSDINYSLKIENCLEGSEIGEEKIENLFKEITHIAVTTGPGLIGSLLVGFNTAKSLAYALDIPVVPINHIEGHIYSALSGENPKSEYRNSKQYQNNKNRKSQKISNFVLRASNFPILALTVSGGHTSLTLMKDHGVYENIGATIDDAAGEAFDKVAKMLDLGYPGGPIVSKFAYKFRHEVESKKLKVKSNNEEKHNFTNIRNNQCKSVRETAADSAGGCGGDFNIKFPRPLLDRPDFNFSFSGLKTSVLYTVQKLTANGQPLTADLKKQICYEFEEAVVDVLVTKTMRAIEKHQPKSVILAGGVSANLFLRKRLAEELKNQRTKEHDSIEFLLPPLELCGDNAAMIGLAAYYHIIRGDTSTWDKIKVDSNIKL